MRQNSAYDIHFQKDSGCFSSQVCTIPVALDLQPEFFYYMDFLEKDLERIIFETDDDTLTKRGFHIFGKRFHQLHIGNYGRCDVMTFFKNRYTEKIIISIYELKKSELNTDVLLQAMRYVRGIQRYLEKRDRLQFADIEYRIYLVGKTVNMNSNFIYAGDVLDNIYLYTYSYKFDGISFSRVYSWELTNEGF